MKFFSCILLAGGRSSRMGVDKATLLAPTQVDLLTYMVHQAELAGAAEVIINRSPHSIPEHLKRHRIIADKQAGLGPLGGLQVAMQACKHSTVLVLPLDMPALAPHFMTTLVETAFDSAQPCAFYYQGYPLPCVLPNQSFVINEIHAVLALKTARERSLQTLLTRLHAQAVIIPNTQERYFMNTNTPAQWTQFIEEYTK